MSSSPTSSSSSEPAEGASPFDAIGSVRCPVTVLLGTGTISVRQCLELQRQMVLRLVEAAGEDLTVLVGGVAVARGEVVLIDNSAAIRVTDLTPSQVVSRRSA